MKAWKKGAIVGAVWGLVSIAPYSKIDITEVIWMKSLYAIFGFPTDLAIKLGFRFYLIFIGAPLIGILIGALLGYLYDLLKKRGEK